jgi:uncharacterized protein (DUF885 family)
MTVAPGITSPAPEGQAAGNAQANNMESRQTQFLSLLDEEWQYELRSDPEMATTLGDTRYNDRLTEHSLQFHRSDVEAKRKFLARFEALDPAGFPQQSALSRDLMIRNLRQGMQDHLMPPSYLLEKVTVQAQEIANQSGEASPFAKPLAKFPSGISADDQLRLRSAILAAINTEILPAYKRFSGFVRDDYAPMGVQTRESGLFPMAPRATALKSGASPRLTWLRSRFTSSASSKSPRPRLKCWPWLTNLASTIWPA